MSAGPAEMVAVRAALDRAEADTPGPGPGASAARHQAAFAARSRANAVELAR